MLQSGVYRGRPAAKAYRTAQQQAAELAIATTSLQHGLIVVTRDASDFELSGHGHHGVAWGVRQWLLTSCRAR